MAHLHPEALLRYLNGEVDLADTEAMTAHLHTCDHCTALLAEIAAEETHLMDVLALDEAEASWVGQTDLTPAIMQVIAPQSPTLVSFGVATLFLVPGAYMLSQFVSLGWRMYANDGPVGMALDLVPALWNLLGYLSHGGLLTTLWPLVLLGAAAVLWSRKNKEATPYA